jgi:sulfhydrogenase subunit delta
MGKPTVGIFGLTGCAGDQLAILNCEDELLDLVSVIDIRDFLMGSSGNDTACTLDVALVEGAVLSNKDAEMLQAVRRRSGLLVALGTCAVWGGVATLDRGADRARLLAEIYGDTGRGYDAIAARALHELVKVDLNITGCPIEKDQFIAAIAGLLNGDLPSYPDFPVCTECRMRENNCLLIERGAVCCGPLTMAGCKARCPELRIPCIGCRGPLEDGNAPAMIEMLEAKGFTRRQVEDKLRTFAPIGDGQ